MTAANGGPFGGAPALGRTGPVADEDSRSFWAAAAQHRLELQQCQDCGETRFPPMPSCPACGSVRWETTEAAARGQVYSWITVRRPIGSIVEAELPLRIATVELQEGCRMVGRLREGTEPRMALPVRVYYVDHAGWTEIAFQADAA